MKKIIVHIVEAFGGGIFSILTDLISRTSEDYDITILYGRRPETPNNIKQYFNDNVNLIEIKNFTKKINFIKDIKAIFEVKMHIKQINPDIVHLHSSKAGVIGRIACNKVKTVYYSPHCFAFTQKNISKTKQNIYYFIEKIMAHKRNCSIIACSKPEYEIAKELTTNVMLLENGIDIERIQKCLNNVEVVQNKHTVCTVGRIDSQKNPELFNKIAEQMPEYEFMWIGDGPLRNTLTSTNIKITGWMTHDEVIRKINENEFFILTSSWEGLPISLLEAMYLKKICIISKSIQNIGIINHGINGYVAENTDNYIKLIKQATKNKTEVSGWLDVKKRYNIDKYVQDYKKIIDKTNPKRTILFTEKFNDGGIEKIVTHIFLGLDRKEYTPDILAFTEDSSIYKKIPKTILINKKIKTSFMRKIIGIRKLKKYFKTNKIDIFHVNTYNSIGLIYAKIAYRYGVNNIVLHAHNSNVDSDPLKVKHFINYIVKILFLNKNYTYISASEQCSSFCFGEKAETIIIPNQIESKEYIYNENVRNEYRKKFMFKRNEFVIGNIGRFEKQKNHKFLLSVFEEIHNQKQNAYLVIVGDGRLKNQIMKQIQRKKLQDFILILEPRNDINKLMQMFDAYVSTSKYEGFGLTILEAQAASLPTYCTEKVPNEVLKTDMVHTISLSESPESWAKIICKNNKKARQKNILKDTISDFVKKIEKIYKTIVF